MSEILFVIVCAALFGIAFYVAIRDHYKYTEDQFNTLRELHKEVTQYLGRIHSELDEHVRMTTKQLTALATRVSSLEGKSETQHREVALIGPIEVRLLKEEPKIFKFDEADWHGGEAKPQTDDEFTENFEAELRRIEEQRTAQRKAENDDFLERVNRELKKAHRAEIRRRRPARKKK